MEVTSNKILLFPNKNSSPEDTGEARIQRIKKLIKDLEIETDRLRNVLFYLMLEKQ